MNLALPAFQSKLTALRGEMPKNFTYNTIKKLKWVLHELESSIPEADLDTVSVAPTIDCIRHGQRCLADMQDPMRPWRKSRTQFRDCVRQLDHEMNRLLLHIESC